MIASNFRKYPEAAALQQCLPLGKPRWNGSRPTTRAGRAMRSAQAAVIAATPQLVQWVKKAVPEWAKAKAQAARRLANSVKNAMQRML